MTQFVRLSINGFFALLLIDVNILVTRMTYTHRLGEYSQENLDLYIIQISTEIP